MRCILLAILLAACCAQRVAGQPAEFADLGSLKLQVASFEVVDKIEIGGGGMGTPLLMTPKEGHKLWMVKLKGKVPKPCKVGVSPLELLAAWVTKQDFGGQPSSNLNVEPAHHVRAGDRWVASYATEYTRAPVDVEIVFAVTLPAEVSQFHVMYGTFAQGVVGGGR